MMDHRLARLLAVLPIGFALLGLISPGAALANPTITITFDGATFDPNPPPNQEGTPNLTEGGALYRGFWFQDVALPGAYHETDHTHVLWDDKAVSLVDNPHSWRNGLQGAHISLLDGSPFSVVSIDYRIYERLPPAGPDPNDQFARLPWSQPWDDVHLLLSENADPMTPDFATFEAQWTAFAIDDHTELEIGGGLTDPYQPADSSPWRTLQISGFDDITEIFIAHTGAHVAFDNIVIAPSGGGGIPEPGTGILLGMGLGLLAARRRPRVA